MSVIKFDRQEKQDLVEKIQVYFEQKLDREIGQFDAEFLLDFFSEEVGVYFYNRGLYDAQAVLESRLEMLSEAILELEKET